MKAQDYSTMFTLMLVLSACGDESAIEPDPTSSTGTTTPTTSSSGTGGDGQGGDGAGGDGTGGTTMPGGGYESGTRLKVRTLVGDDGARQPAGWYDSQLGVECTFRPDKLGAQRCLPLASRAGYWTDPSCTSNPILWVPCGAAVGTHVEVPISGCSAVEIHALGNTVSAPNQVYTKDYMGNCSIGAQVPPPGGTWYAVGAEVQPSNFVGATVETEQ